MVTVRRKGARQRERETGRGSWAPVTARRRCTHPTTRNHGKSLSRIWFLGLIERERERETSHSPACIYVPTYLVRAASPPSHASRDSRNPPDRPRIPVRKICRNSSERNPPSILDRGFGRRFYFFHSVFRKGKVGRLDDLERTTDVWGLEEVLDMVEVGGWSRKKKGNIVWEDWINQREKEAGLVTRMSWYIKELVLWFEVRRLIRFVSGR